MAAAELDRPTVPVMDGEMETCMEDKMVEGGVIERPEVAMKDDDFHMLLQEERDKIDFNEFKSIEQLEDEQLAEDQLEMYRRKRIAELIQQKKAEKFGTIVEITETEFEKEVKEAGVFVIMLIYRPGLEDCTVLEKCLAAVAAKFRHLKFVKIMATGRNIKNFPLTHCPTVMVYNSEGGVMDQFVTIASFHGLKTTADIVEWEFAKLQLLDTELEDDPRNDKKNQFKIRQQSKYVGSRHQDSDSEEDFDL